MPTKKQMTNQCPFAVYPYECEKDDCTGCSIRIEAAAKANEEIAENMEDYWKHLR